MNTTTIQSVNEQIFQLISERVDIDAKYLLDIDTKYDDFDSIRDELDDAGAFDKEIIYYSRAIEFLSENDNSLRRSLEIANDMGFNIANLSSEVLASLLASEITREDFAELQDQIEELINEYPEEEEQSEDEDQQQEEE